MTICLDLELLVDYPLKSANNFPIALTEYKEEYRAARGIPGSHQWDDLDALGTSQETVPTEIRAGDALLICGNVVHFAVVGRFQSIHGKRGGRATDTILTCTVQIAANSLSDCEA